MIVLLRELVTAAEKCQKQDKLSLNVTGRSKLKCLMMVSEQSSPIL